MMTEIFAEHFKRMLCFKRLGDYCPSRNSWKVASRTDFLQISELFEVFDQEPALWCVKGVALAVLATYTWSFMQFTLVFTATAETVPDDKKLQTKVCN